MQERIALGKAAPHGLGHQHAQELHFMQGGVVAGRFDPFIARFAPFEVFPGVGVGDLPGILDLLRGQKFLHGVPAPAVGFKGLGCFRAIVIGVEEARNPFGKGGTLPVAVAVGFLFLALVFLDQAVGAVGFFDVVAAQAGRHATVIAFGRLVFNPPVGRIGSWIFRGHIYSIYSLLLDCYFFDSTAAFSARSRM